MSFSLEGQILPTLKVALQLRLAGFPELSPQTGEFFKEVKFHPYLMNIHAKGYAATMLFGT